MYRFIAVSLVCLCSFFAGSAKDWTPEQQEVLDHIQGCWDGWEKSIAERNFDHWTKACRPDPDLLWWWQGDGIPQDLDAFTRMTKWELETTERVVFSDFRPVDVKLHGDTAIVMNYGYAGWIDTNGKRAVAQDYRLSVLQKKDGVWTFIAEMVIDVKDKPDWVEETVKD